MTERELAIHRIEGLLKKEFAGDPEWFGDAGAILAQMPVVLCWTANECGFDDLALFAMHDLFLRETAEEEGDGEGKP